MKYIRIVMVVLVSCTKRPSYFNLLQAFPYVCFPVTYELCRAVASNIEVVRLEKNDIV